MHNLSELADRLKDSLNYIFNLKHYCDKLEKGNLDEVEREDIFKYLDLSFDNLFYILRYLFKLYTSKLKYQDNRDLLESMQNLYILSDKSIEKAMYLDEYYRKIKGCKDIANDNLLANLTPFAELYDDILDELYDYLNL